MKPVLYAACVTELSDESLYAAACERVSEARREKAERLRFEKDKRLSVGAELLLRYALRPVGVEELSFAYGEYEKPCLQGRSIHFNLSHSGEWVLCAVGGCELGCDIEQLAPVNLKIAKRFFAPDEYEDIAAAPTPEEQRERFFRYWTLKESFMKATGLGLRLPMNEFSIRRGEKIAVRQSVDERDYVFREYSDIDGYCCALCTAGQEPEPTLRIVDVTRLLADA